MAQRLVTSAINTNIPAAYPFINVISNPVGTTSSGILVIFGEADGGDSYKNVVLKNNFFTPNQLSKVKQQYISGQVVDAFQALAAPSADADITGSANRIYIVKTNTSAKASAIIPTNYGTLSDKNWGIPGNNYKYQITSIAAEVGPAVSGGTIPSLGAALNGASFTVRQNGGVAEVITLSGTATDHDTIPHLVAELNSLFAAASPVLTLTASPGSAPSSIEISSNVDASAYGKGWGKSFELVDSTPGDLASLGLVIGLSVSSQEPGVELDIVRQDIGVNQSIDVSATIALQVGYQGTTATITISDTAITTAVTGGSGAALNIPISQFKTCADLATYIASQTGYSAVCAPSAQQVSPSALDEVSAVGIASTATGLLPGRIKKAANDFAIAANNSALAFAPGVAGIQGLPAPTASATYLTGGTRGATLASDIIAVLTQLGSIQCNIIIPCFSQDASKDITAGLTDSASTYTIAAINAATKSHCLAFSTPELKRNRTAIMSILDTYANAKAQAQSLGNFRCSLTMQQISQVNSAGAITLFQPWYAAVIAAGMQAGGFYKSILNKEANIISFTDPVGFDSGDPGDVSDGLNSGLLFLSQDTDRAGYWVSDQTTYGFDTNFVYNSIQAVYASDLIALDLAQSFFLAFVGKSLADVDAATGLSFLAQKMDQYKKQKLIAASTDAPLGYKNQGIQINGPEMDVQVEIKLATAIYFIPININISQVQSAA